MSPQLTPEERSRLFRLLPMIKAEDRRQQVEALAVRANRALLSWRRR